MFLKVSCTRRLSCILQKDFIQNFTKIIELTYYEIIFYFIANKVSITKNNVIRNIVDNPMILIPMY